MAADHALERLGLLQGQVVLGAAPRAGQVDMLDLVGAVVLGPGLEVGVANHADRLEERQRAVDGRRVDRGEPALDPTGDVQGRDVPLGAEDLLEDDLPLGGDAVAPFPEHGRHGPRLVHALSVSALACALQVRLARNRRRPLRAKVPSFGHRLMMPAGR
jgi:hypothetical protein